MTQPGVDASNDPARFLRDLRGRINALAVATSTVMERTDQSTATLERVIRRQVEPLLSNPSAQLEISGSAVDVGTEGAQQISLVVWELASRFAQNRSAANRGQRIKVEWSVDRRTEGGDRLQLEWRVVGDRFGAATNFSPIDPLSHDRSDFGGVLLTKIVPQLLRGKGCLEQEGDQLVYRLNCPLDALMQVGGRASEMEFANDIIREDLRAGAD